MLTYIDVLSMCYECLTRERLLEGFVAISMSYIIISDTCLLFFFHLAFSSSFCIFCLVQWDCPWEVRINNVDLLVLLNYCVCNIGIGEEDCHKDLGREALVLVLKEWNTWDYLSLVICIRRIANLLDVINMGTSFDRILCALDNVTVGCTNNLSNIFKIKWRKSVHLHI